ncbi:MAG: hypothetical protein GVX96_03715 [Bacteroidetes bacterium]|jgi:hypothetical protein|nr:hypothetical protein [Bacteroidota bacterium]
MTRAINTTLKLCILGGIWFLSSCQQDPIPDVENKASDIPLLMGTNKIGTIKGFNPSNPAQTKDSIEDRWNDALLAGMSVGRLQIDWPELEPSPNTYDRENFEQRLAAMQAQGLQPFLLISAYDSGEPVVPDDLRDKDFDDPEFIQRFKNLMNWVIPLLVEYEGFLISISNEAENSFGEVPDLENQLLYFLKEIKAHVHQINKNMPVTVTISEGSLDEDKPAVYELLDECDVACFNFYGAKSAFSPPFYYLAQSESEIRSDIQRMIEVAGEKYVVIQELGMYSGNTTLNSSQETQRKFFEVFFKEMENEPQLRAAFNFQLVDWSPEVTAIFSEELVNEGASEEFVNQFAESLTTMGLIHYTDGSRKKAWNEFLFWLESFEE